MASIGRAFSPTPTFAQRASGQGLAYHWQAMIVITVGSFSVFLNMTIVNIALPRIISVFQTTLDQAQLVLTGFMVALAIVMPATGYIADRFGPKRAYLVSVALYTIGSALCGLAPNIEGLVVFRVLQGLGGGITQPLGMSILLGAVPANQRGAIMGVYGVPTLIAPIIGPTLGGWIVEYLDWRLVFLISLPPAVIGILLGMVMLRETPPKGGSSFDWPGFILAAVGFTAALLAFNWAPSDGWFAPNIVVLWLIAAVALPAWVIVELSQAKPLLDLTIFRDQTYTIATILNFITNVALFSTLTILPIFLQNVRGLGAMETGMLLFPQALMACMIMPFAGRIADRFGAKPLVIPGLILLGFSTFAFASLDVSTSDSTIRWLMALRGITMGCMMMPVTAVSMNNLAPWQIPRASALTNVSRQVFSAFGTCFMTTILLDRTRHHSALLQQTVTPENLSALQVVSSIKISLLERGWSEIAAQSYGLAALSKQVALAASVKAYDDCFWIGAVMAFVGLIPALFLKHSRGGRRGPEPAPAPARPTR